MSRRGKPLLRHGAYSYYQKKKTGFTQVMSRRGKPLLRHGAYSYYQKKKTGLKTSWVCSTHHPKGCKGAIVTVESEIIRLNENHNH
ncbi:hypothetical protein ABMA27_001369 [Loxostege sticticalis]|uniref:FLYWCH-type domain-containing protein n=1 Tax=Loxostege sticticalis TaxID=481309 RepID=A0ABR3HY86_LOXSC